MIRRPPRSTLFPSTPLFRPTADNAGTVTAGGVSTPFSDISNLIGSRGNDVFAFTPGAELSGRINALVDRKSTRLNSSHAHTSYAVFCLQKTRSTPDPTALHQ